MSASLGLLFLKSFSDAVPLLMIYKTEVCKSMDCGSSFLAMTAGYHGKEVAKEHLREIYYS